MLNSLEQTCRELEHFETEEWAAAAILNKEILTNFVLDPCCGGGVLSRAAKQQGYSVLSNDIHNWGYEDQHMIENFLEMHEDLRKYTVFVNPPFSLACQFVDHALRLGARKVVCFQRYSWYEGSFKKGAKRGLWWKKNPPNRIYVCGDRASCWRFDLPKDDQGNRYNPHTGKKLSNTPTTHAWFIWEQGQPLGTLTGHIYKEDSSC